MVRKRRLLVLLLFLALASCAREDGDTPVPAPSLTPLPAGTVVQLDQLISSPQNYEGQLVRVSGQFSVLPQPLCNGLVRFSPATWALSAQGVSIRAAGMEEVLLNLVPDNLTLIVDGHWRRWEGLIGCGNAAVKSTVWYLELVRILSPNPLVRLTLTPFGSPPPLPETPIALVSPTPGGEPGQTLLPSPPVLPTQTSAATRPVSTSTLPAATPTRQTSPLPTPTGPFSPIATPTMSGSTTPSALPTLEPPASPTLEASTTVYPTFTPISTSDATGTPDPTVTPSPTPLGGPVDMGEIALDDVINARLYSGEVHRWYFDALNGDVITITVAPALGVDLELVINDPKGLKIAGRDYRPAGQAETIANLALDQNGFYQIVVNEVNGHSGDYAVLVMDEFSIPVVFPGNLTYGSSSAGSLPAGTYHIWHFLGDAGDLVDISLDPTDNSDLILTLYGPDMSQIARVDQQGPGDPELLSYTLTADGFYAILVKEYGGVASEYDLVLTDD